MDQGLHRVDLGPPVLDGYIANFSSADDAGDFAVVLILSLLQPALFGFRGGLTHDFPETGPVDAPFLGGLAKLPQILEATTDSPGFPGLAGRPTSPATSVASMVNRQRPSKSRDTPNVQMTRRVCWNSPPGVKDSSIRRVHVENEGR